MSLSMVDVTPYGSQIIFTTPHLNESKFFLSAKMKSFVSDSIFGATQKTI